MAARPGLFGGLIGGLGVGLLVAHRRGVQVFRLLDACAPSIAIAIAIGRIGDLLLLDHLGKATSSVFALAYRVPLGAHLAPGFGPSPAIRPPTARRAPTSASSTPAVPTI